MNIDRIRNVVAILAANLPRPLRRSLRAVRKVALALLLAPATDYFTGEANFAAEHLDFTAADVTETHTLHRRHYAPIEVRAIRWFVPRISRPYYGGVYTVLRFAEYFARAKGARPEFIVEGGPDDGSMVNLVREAFPAFSSFSVFPSSVLGELDSNVDVAIATYWTTAYSVLKCDDVKRKFYFIQDYEPLFYPAGSASGQAQATYRFGFYGIGNTEPLAALYRDVYQGSAISFAPCVDTSMFYPEASAGGKGQPHLVFFYARPSITRNGFELGTRALRMVKHQLGGDVRIVCAGAAWNPAAYDLEGIVENLGMLTHRETAELYRKCDIGLAMMFTHHPSYIPLELMASGCLVVCNTNPATRWLLHDGETCLVAEASPSSLSEAIMRGLKDDAMQQRISKHASALVREQYSDWNREMDDIFTYICDPASQASIEARRHRHQIPEVS